MYDDEDSYEALNNDSPAEDVNNEDEENEEVSNTGIWEAVKAATTSAEKLNILLGTTKKTTKDDSDVDMSGVEAGMNEEDMDQSGIFVNDKSDSTVMNSEVGITNPANDTNQDVACDQSKDEVEKIPEKPKETKEPLSLNTHVKLAEYVAKALGHEIGFDPERDLIMIYDHEKQKWQNDVKLHTTKKSIRRIFKQLVESMDEGKDRENLTNNVEHASIPYRVATELKLVVDEVNQDKFDANPMLMGVQNGVIDLTTGEFRPGRIDDYITRTAGVSYVPTATCPLFEQVAYEIMGENMEMYEYLQMLMGYLCMGHNPDQIFVIMQGRGDNGKSLLLNIIEAMLGNYATPMALPTVVDNGRETVGDDLMSLIGFRTFVARELKKEQKLHAAKLKVVTGNDRVSARHLYGRFTPIRPRGVPIIVTNEIPEITDGSNGLWRRLRLMPFTYVVPENKKDTELEKKLLPELPGILNWSLRGLKKYQAGLFKEPKIMLDMKQHLRDERSPLEIFLFSHYEKSSEVKVGSKELHEDYMKWINTTAFGKNMTLIAFSKAVVNLGIEKTRPNKTMFSLKRKEVIGWNEDEMED